MSVTLYRKYRPSTFAEVVSQDHIKHALQHEIINGQLAHAYLFSGPRGLGKTTTARLLAKAVNCTNRAKDSAEPCNACDVCNAILANQSLDVIEIDAASHRGINEIRALKDHIGFTPSGATYRVFIIDEVHMLTNEAFNALLKTLEEPPTHALFILATTELHKVPETIKSRCQMFTFSRVNRDQTIQRLEHLAKQEKVKVDADVLARIAHLSGGFLRDAESLLGQILSLGEKNITKETASLMLPASHEEQVRECMLALATREVSNALAIVHAVVDNGGDIYTFAKELLETTRQLLLTHYGASSDGDMWRELAQKFTPEGLVQLATILAEVVTEIPQSYIPTLPLEMAMVAYCGKQAPKDKEQKTNNIQESINQEEIVQGSSSEDVEEEVQESVVSIDTAEEPVLTKEVKNDTNNEHEAPQDGLVAEEEESTEAPAIVGALSLELLRERWNDVISAGRKHNHSISLALKMAHPYKMTEKAIELGCAYAFHLKRLQDDKSIKMIQTVFKELFGESLDVSVVKLTQEQVAEIAPEEVVDEATQTQEVSAALEAFGGQVVG